MHQSNAINMDKIYRNTFVSLFDDTSEREFIISIQSNVKCLGSDKKRNMINYDSKFVLINKKSNKVFAVARSSGSCIKPLLTESRHVYSNNKYNTYEIPLRDVFIFKKPLDISTLKSMLTIPANNISNNISHLGHLNFTRVFIKDEREIEILKILDAWILTYI